MYIRASTDYLLELTILLPVLFDPGGRRDWACSGALCAVPGGYRSFVRKSSSFPLGNLTLVTPMSGAFGLDLYMRPDCMA